MGGTPEGRSGLVYQIGEAGNVAEDDSGIHALTIWSMMAASMRALACFHYETEERTAEMVL